MDTAQQEAIFAPPLFPVKYFNRMYMEILSDRELRIDLPRLLFGEMDMRFVDMVRPGDIVVSKSRILGVEDKDSGQVLSVISRLMCEGEIKTEAVSSFFIRFRGGAKPARRMEAAQKPFELSWEEAMAVKPNQSYLFADAADDHNPIHVDENVAKAVGLDGIILHGLCTMAFNAQALVNRAANGDPRRLKRLKVRFSKPVRPGDVVLTQARLIESKDEINIYAFRAVTGNHVEVITGGIAEIKNI
jgi:acyl dehydratase